MNNIFQNYQKGMAAFDNCHSSTVQSQWVALKDEIGEFVQEPNLNEIWDKLFMLLVDCFTNSSEFRYIYWPAITFQ